MADPVPAARRFGGYLKALREARRLTLEQVERATGLPAAGGAEPVSRSLLSRVEQGRAGLSVDKLLALARLYGVRASLLADRFELACEAAGLQQEGAEAEPLASLLERAAAAGRAGQVRRALLLYEEAERRALRGEAGARTRARLGVARALAAAGRHRAARAVLEEVLGDPLPRPERVWAFYYFGKASLDLREPLLARAAQLALRDIPGPWPAEIEAAAPSFEGEFLLLEGRLPAAEASFLAARDAARGAGDATHEAACLFRLAEIARRAGRLAEADGWLDRARALAATHGLAQLAVHADTEEGRLRLAARRPDLAREAWARARRLAGRLDLAAELFDIHVELFRLARHEGRAGDERTALHHLRRLSLALERIPPSAADVEPLLLPRPRP